jgi:polyhydroxybutyrate depolymerase
LPNADIPAQGTYKKKLDITLYGIKRNYLLHIPANFSPAKKSPLVLVIHGAFSTAKQIEKQSGFSALSDQEGFLVAYPNGAFGLIGVLQHWNAGHCCGKAATDDVDDVGFLVKVIEDIRGRFNVDPSRLYMVGFSNGGMLTYRFAAEQTNVLAAAAPMAAALGGKPSSEAPYWETPLPQAPLPVIIFHGRDDPIVPYDGGRSPRRGGEREYASVEASVAFWVETNRCDSRPETEELNNGRVIRQIWSDRRDHNDVVLFTIEEWGHEWPGRFFTNRLEDSDPLYGFDAAAIIWDFFKKNAR